jgi:ribonuclease E
MSKKLLIDARSSDETRVVLLNNNVIEDIDYEISHRKQLKGNIYLAKVTRVEPSLQAAFVEYGGNRQGFLAFSEIHPDYYRIPVEDREKLLAEEREHAETETDSDADPKEDHDDDNGDDSDSGNGFDPDDERLRRRRFERFRRHYTIQEVISRRQIMLIQVVKEERGNKGAALTTYLSLAGRYCVLMPNTYHSGGVSRKITDATDRKKLKTIVNGLDVPTGMAVIVRTAGSKRTKAEITRDYNYLMRQWNEIRETTMASSAPSIIYEEGNLIKRAVRDYYTSDVDEIVVEGAEGYKSARAHMKNLMPTHVKKVTEHSDSVSHLFQSHKVENMLAEMHNPEVTLKSGGYIVLNQTEALVAIDVNSGKATRERNIEETALKTNLEAAVEISRQLKLRDLSGLVVIDFIDMDYSRNKSAVERKLKEALKHDRARVQIGSISQFGLLEMSRQRLRPSLSEAVSDLCPHCHGTGRIQSVESAALAVIHQIEGEVARKPRAKLTVAMATEVALYILNHKREAISELESRFQMTIILEQDNSLLPPHVRFEGISEKQAQPERRKAKQDTKETQENTSDSQAASPDTDGDGDGDDDENKPKRRRRRGKRGGRNRNRRDNQGADNNAEAAASSDADGGDAVASQDATAKDTSDQASGNAGENNDVAKAADDDGKTMKKPARRRGRKPAASDASASDATDGEVAVTSTDAAEANTSPEKEEKPKRSPRRRKAASPKPEAEVEVEAKVEAGVEAGVDSKTKTRTKAATTSKDNSASDEASSAPVKKTRSRKAKADSDRPEAEATEDAPTKPKRGRKKQDASVQDANTKDASAQDTPRVAEVSADINVVDVSTVSTEKKKKGWWSR